MKIEDITERTNEKGYRSTTLNMVIQISPKPLIKVTTNYKDIEFSLSLLDKNIVEVNAENFKLGRRTFSVNSTWEQDSYGWKIAVFSNSKVPVKSYLWSKTKSYEFSGTPLSDTPEGEVFLFIREMLETWTYTHPKEMEESRRIAVHNKLLQIKLARSEFQEFIKQLDEEEQRLLTLVE